MLGGSLAEGIDLPGERLESVVVVSTGAPQPDARVQAMRAYFDAQGRDGFFLCMTWPGMVRVVQAAGRLIRTDADTGALLLIDSRYAQGRIRALLEGTLIGDALGRGITKVDDLWNGCGTHAGGDVPESSDTCGCGSGNSNM